MSEATRKEGQMNEKEKIIFAALKLVEQLYKDGKIPRFMFKNIMNDYADEVDLSHFTADETEKKEVKAA